METLCQNIVGRIKPILDKAGIYYRIFSRVKSEESIKKKLENKAEEYKAQGKKMQDIIGIRIVFYFQEDVEIFYKKLKLMDGYDEMNESNSSKELKEYTEIIDAMNNDNSDSKSKLTRLLPFHDKIFMPERLNIVMQMNLQEKEMLNGYMQKYDNSDLIDTTFEIQLRTVLSEGWHEVEHDLRYKTKKEEWWNYCGSESRMLNGIYASLETNERALSQMIQEITYKNYKHQSWDAMIRFHFCKRMSEEKLPTTLCNILNNDERLAKDILHISKRELSEWLWEIPSKVNLSTQFVLFLLNRKKIKNEEIYKQENLAMTLLLNSIKN